MTFYRRLRLSYGLHWPTNRVPMPIRDIAIVLGCLLVYGLVAKIDELGDRAALMERAAVVEGAHADVLRNCERGASGYYYTDGRAFECPRKL